MMNITKRSPLRDGKFRRRLMMLLVTAPAIVVGVSILGANAAPPQVSAAKPPAPAPVKPSPATTSGAAPTTSGQAAVLVSCLGEHDVVNLLLSPQLPRDQVRGIVQRLNEAGKWHVRDVKIEDDRFVSAWDALNPKQKISGTPQTYVEFTATGIVNRDRKWIDLNPFILALKERAPLRVKVWLPQGLNIEWPGDFENNQVKLECDRQANGPRYNITVKDLNATAAPTPLPAPAVIARASRPPARSSALFYTLACLLAVTTVALGGLMWRKGRGPRAAKGTATTRQVETGKKNESGG